MVEDVSDRCILGFDRGGRSHLARGLPTPGREVTALVQGFNGVAHISSWGPCEDLSPPFSLGFFAEGLRDLVVEPAEAVGRREAAFHNSAGIHHAASVRSRVGNG